MASTEVLVKFVGYKVSTVRWRPVSQGSLQESDVFVTASWDNGTHNKLSLWQVSERDPSALTNSKHEVCLLGDRQVSSSITDIQFIDLDKMVVSYDNGSVEVYRSHHDSLSMVQSQWGGLHDGGCTGVSVSVDGSSIVSGGDDNKICLLSTESAAPVRIIEDADVSGINAVTFSQLAEVLSVSSVGHLKVWDLRNTSNKPVKTLKMSDDGEGLHCVRRHPTHPHLVVTGRSDGSVCFWDLRHHQQPLSVMGAHTDIAWEAQFHPSYPNHLFTCSNDGCLWHWDASKVASSSSTTSQDSSIAPWLTRDVLASGMDVINLLPNSVLPINSLDIVSNRLLAGSDNEAIYMIPNMNIS